MTQRSLPPATNNYFCAYNKINYYWIDFHTEGSAPFEHPLLISSVTVQAYSHLNIMAATMPTSSLCPCPPSYNSHHTHQHCIPILSPRPCPYWRHLSCLQLYWGTSSQTLLVKSHRPLSPSHQKILRPRLQCLPIHRILLPGPTVHRPPRLQPCRHCNYHHNVFQRSCEYLPK